MTLLLIVVGSIFVGVLIRKYIKPDTSNGLLGAVFFVPALLYWVADKSPSELSGFGFSAKFEDVAAKPVESLLTSVGDTTIPPPPSPDSSFALSSLLEDCSKYYVVRPHLVPNHDTAAFAPYIVNLTYSIRSSIACDSFIGLVILDENDHYIGSYDRDFFAESLSLWAAFDSDKPIDAKMLANRIQSSTIFGAALRFPKERIQQHEGYVGAINEDASLGDAFALFQGMHGTFLVVTDVLGKFKGIITRDYVQRALLEALVASSSDTEK